MILRDSLKNLESLLIFQSGGYVSFPQVKQIKKPAFLVPFDRDQKFVGRSIVIQDIDDRIKTQRRVALYDIGGIG
jgi:hypothetical protein